MCRRRANPWIPALAVVGACDRIRVAGVQARAGDDGRQGLVAVLVAVTTKAGDCDLDAGLRRRAYEVTE